MKSVETPLYKLYNIQVDLRHLNNVGSASIVDFIVDQKDFSENDILFPNETADIDEEEENNVDENVLLFNQDSLDNIQVIAPGQGKNPVPWHIVKDLEELCFPTI
jgi:hypothetical protein